MRTIETTATVSQDGRLIVETPDNIPPGDYRVILIEQPIRSNGKRPFFDRPPISVGKWPENFVVNRDEIYDDGEL